jgi:FMN phosphatase YigB (HAD superfamily)
MVGDNLADDIEGAIASGVRAVLVDRADRHPDYAGERIRGLVELPPLLGFDARAAAPSGPRGRTA